MRRIAAIALGLSLLTGLPFFARSAVESGTAPDLLLVGRVFTGDSAQPWAEAVAVSAGQFSYVGTRAGAPAGATRTVDVKDGVILPGLVDAHAHLLGLGMALQGVDLTGTKSYEEILERVRGADKQMPAGRWLLGRGWDQNDWPAKDFPHRKQLDAVCPSRPVVLERIDGHAVLANAAALDASKIDRNTPDPEGGKILRDPDGQPTGVLIDRATDLVRVPAPTLEQRVEALGAAMKLAADAGLTGVHDMGNDLDTIRAFRQMADAGLLPIRVYALVSSGSPAMEEAIRNGPQVGLGRDGRLTIRAVKFYADGALGSRGAALEEPYSDDPQNRGLLLIEPEKLCSEMERVAQAGLQPATHAIGDRGNRMVLDCAERLDPATRAKVRPRDEHTQVVRLQDIERFGKLGVIASMQPTHATSDMPWAEDRVGPERIKGAYAWRSLKSAGARLAFGSDFPVESHRPLLGLYAAVTRQDATGTPDGGWFPDQRLTLDEAVEGFTMGAAYAAFEESTLGSITVGKLADLTVLDRDLWKLPPKAILDAGIRMTVVGGKVEFEQK